MKISLDKGKKNRQLQSFMLYKQTSEFPLTSKFFSQGALFKRYTCHPTIFPSIGTLAGGNMRQKLNVLVLKSFIYSPHIARDRT